MNELLHIAKNAFLECLREPAVLVVFFVTALINAVLPITALFVFREQFRMIVDNSMATMLLGGIAVSVFAANAVLNREIEYGTAALIFSKPVSRVQYIVGKIIGVSGTMLIYGFCSSLQLLICLRCALDQFRLDWSLYGMMVGLTMVLPYVLGALRNYLKRSNFCQNALLMLPLCILLCTVIAHFLPTKNPKDMGLNLHVGEGAAILCLGLIFMGVVGVTCSTRLRLSGSLICSFCLFMLGAMADYIFGLSASKGNVLASLSQAFIPNWQSFWQAEALSSGVEIPHEYFWVSLLYMLSLTLVFGVLACWLFETRELDGKGTVS